MQTKKTYREESQGGLGRKPADVSLTGCANSLETLQCECVAQTSERREPSSIQVPSRGALACPGWRAAAARCCAPAAATLVPQQQLNFGWVVCRDHAGAQCFLLRAPLGLLGFLCSPGWVQGHHLTWRELSLLVAPQLPHVIAPHYQVREARLPCSTSPWGSSAPLPTCWDGVIYLCRYLVFSLSVRRADGLVSICRI